MDYLYKRVNKLYETAGFLEKYGGSIVMTVILFLVFDKIGQKRNVILP